MGHRIERCLSAIRVYGNAARSQIPRLEPVQAELVDRNWNPERLRKIDIPGLIVELEDDRTPREFRIINKIGPGWAVRATTYNSDFLGLPAWSSRNVAWCLKMPTKNSIAYLLVFVVGAVAGSIQVAWMPGVPAHGRYHACDSDYLQKHLLGISLRPGPPAPTADHPAWKAICGVYQKISAMCGLSGMTLWNIATPVILGVNLCLFLLLTRNLGFDRAQGLGLTFLLLSTGATVNWSMVLETHVLAPTSLLLAALILSDRRMVSRIWNHPSSCILLAYGLAIALAGSITITNAMLGVLAVLPARLIRRLRPAPIVKQTIERIPILVTAGLVSIGILAFVHLTGWYLTQDPEMAQFLAVANERHYLPYMMGSWWESVLAVAWVAPPLDQYIGYHDDTFFLLRRNLSTMPAFLSGLLVFTLTVCSIRFASSREMFIPIFVVVGIALHSVYGRSESFLFAANYTWATVISIGILGRVVIPKHLCRGTLAISSVLFVVNIAIWAHGFGWIIENGYLLPDP